MHRLLVIGATAAAATVLCGPAAAWSWPADGPVLRQYGLGADAYAAGQHRGVDIGGSEGSPIRAPASGTVTFVGSLPTHGRGVTILTTDGWAVTLVHLGATDVGRGAAVVEGDAVGTMGWSGTPEHSVPTVHLGVRRADEPEGYVDPLGLLPARPTAPLPVPTPGPSPAPTPTPAATSAVSPPTPVAPPPVPVAAQPAPAPPLPPIPAPAATPAADAPSPAASPPAPAVPVAAPGVSANVALPAGAAVDSPSPASATDPAPGAAEQGGIVVAQARPTAAPVGSEVAAEPSTRPARRVHESTEGGERAASRVSSPPSVAGATGDGTALFVAVAGHASGTTGSRLDKAREVGRPVSARGADALGPAEPSARASAAGGHRLPAADLEQRLTPPPVRATSAEVVRSALRDGGAPVWPLVAAFVLGCVVAGSAVRRAARRIDRDGALLPHDADLLRELDPAHRARVHDRGRGHLRAPSATART